jgi:RHS repeat-associated protein
MQMPGRKYSVANTKYRYGFNGKELDKETSSTMTYDYGFRIYSPGLGRFLSVDPISQSYPWYTPYQFAGNMPIVAIDLDGLEPKTMIDASGKLTQPMITTLNAAFGYSKSSLQNSTWVSYKSNEGKLWAKIVGIPSKTSSSVDGNIVVHDDDQNRSDIAWFGLIGHEQSHRQDVDNNPLFYEDYIMQGAVFGYRKIPTEQKAYKYGGDWGNPNDYSDQLLRYKSGIIIQTLNNNFLNSDTKSKILESEGNKFRRDVILNDQLNDLQNKATQLQTNLSSLKGNKFKEVLNWYTIKENEYELKDINQQISSVKNEQKTITDTYGN